VTRRIELRPSDNLAASVHGQVRRFSDDSTFADYGPASDLLACKLALDQSILSATRSLLVGCRGRYFSKLDGSIDRRSDLQVYVGW
jgi:hypothetical protein